MVASVWCDRAGTFDPQLIANYWSRSSFSDDKIISVFARSIAYAIMRKYPSVNGGVIRR